MKNANKILTVAVLVLSLLCGCGGFKKVDTGEKVRISVSSWPSKEGAKLDEMNARLKRFNEKYGDKIEIIPDTYTFDVSTFLPKAASGQLPTLYRTAFTEAKRIVDAGYAADITKQMEQYGYADKINEQIKDLVVRDGKNFFVPHDTYAMGIMANLNVLRKAGLVDNDENPVFPKTYEEIGELAKKVTEKTGKAGFIMPTSGRNGGWHFTVIAWANGVKFMEKIDGKWKATFNTPECVETLQWIKDLKWKYNTLSANNLIDQNEAQKLFATDQGGYYLGSQPSDNLFIQYDMDREAIGMGRIPAGKKSNVSLIGGVIYALAPNATEEQKDAAFKWLEYADVTPYLTEASKASLDSTWQSKSEDGLFIGLKKLAPWIPSSESIKYRDEIIDKYRNINVNHIKQYSDFEGIELRPEEPVCCQDLYGVLDACIQAVLTDKNADCAQIINRAADNFQRNYLDNAK